MNRLISNIVLGFFVVVLVVVYGVAKQQPVYQPVRLTQGDQVVAKQETAQEVQPASVQLSMVETSAELAQIPMPNGELVEARIANSPEEREQGLSGTDPLAQDQGMLFIFDTPDVYGIWMKEMKYDLDLVWFDENGRVVHIVEKAKAPRLGEDLVTYKNEKPAKYVLELPAGRAAEYGLTAGILVEVS